MLFLVRHGESTLNAAGIKYGRLDPPLTPRGAHQATETAHHLDGKIIGIACSTQLRAVQYANLLADLLNLRQPRTYPGLAERSFGEAEGLTREQIARRFPDGPPGMETYEQAAARARRTLALLPAGFAVVTHSGVIRGLTGQSVANGAVVTIGV